MKKQRSLFALIAGWLLFVDVGAHAQSSELESLLEENIVSTPSKQSELASAAPATATIISAEDLRRYGVRSLDEAINYLSLGMLTTDPLHAVEIGARGVLLTADYGNHVLLLVDGHPMNEPWNGTAYFERGAGIPFELVDHIEVMLGPGSVMYGSSAMLGVINIVTKHARDYAGLRIIGEGDAAAPVSRAGAIELSPLSAYGAGYRASAGYGSEFRLFNEPSEVTLQLEYYRQTGPDWQLGPQAWGDDSVTGAPKSWGPNTMPGVWGGTTHEEHYTQAPAGYGRLQIGDFVGTLQANMYERGTPYLDSVVNTGGDFDDPDNREQDRFARTSVSYRKAVSSRVALSVALDGAISEYQWFNTSSAAEECPTGLVAGCKRHLTGSGKVAGGDIQTTYSVPDARSTTLLGVDARLRHASSTFALTNLGTGARAKGPPDYARTDALIAPYLQESWNPLAWLDLNAGLRLDSDTRFGAKLSPRAAVGVAPWANAKLKAIYSEAFRAPTAYELNYSDPGDQIRAPMLGPESVRSVELSAEQRVGVHRMFFGVFRSWWADAVAYKTLDSAELAAAVAQDALPSDTAEAYQYANLGAIDNYGYNTGYEGAAWKHRLRFGFGVTGAYTRMRAGDGTDPVALSVSPSLFGNARASYDFGEKLPTLALATHFLARRPADRAFDGGFTKPPYAPAALELRTTLSGDFPGVENLSYRLSTTFSSAARTAYVIGPYQYAADATTQAELAPITRLSGFLSLQYVIP